MPLTFPAHQAIVLPLKLRWPSRFDATALCVGAAAPDFGNAISRPWSHSWSGAILFALPLTLLLCALLRRGAALGVAVNLPDVGPMRLRSYGVVSLRRPHWAVTLVSAAVGVLSHVVLDAFTHANQWGAQAVGFDRRIPVPVAGDATIAKLLQLSGHVGLSAATLVLLVLIARRRYLEAWYGTEAVRWARSRGVRPGQRCVFWAAAVGVTAAVVVTAAAAGRSLLFAAIVGGVLGVVLAGSLRSAGGGRAARSEQFDEPVELVGGGDDVR